MKTLSILDYNGNKIQAHEGASTGRRLHTWGMSSAGPNNVLHNSLSSLRNRSRELTRNNPLADGGVDSFVANLIGTGITPRWQIKDDAKKEEVQELWSDCVDEFDFEGIDDFYGLQGLAARSLIEAGEVFVLKHFVNDSNLIVPFQIQILESDFCDASYNAVAPNGNKIRMGIEYSKKNKRLAYWMFKEHPGEAFLNGADFGERIRIPADRICHIFKRLRPGQQRGRPWLSSIIVKLHEIDQCSDAELVRRKTTAMFGGFITKPPNEEQRVLGDEEENGIVALEPGTFSELPEGYEVTFSNPKDVGGNYIAWMEHEIRAVAKGIGITYEQFTGDLSKVNFSSIRAGLLEFQRRCVLIQKNQIIFQFCRPVSNDWLKVAVIAGSISVPDFNKKIREYKRIQWRPDGWKYVNPLQDVKAELIAIRSGLKSRDQSIAELGYDIEKVDRDIQRDNQRVDQLKIILDSDPRKTTISGVYQSADDYEEEESNE